MHQHMQTIQEMQIFKRKSGEGKIYHSSV